MEYKSLTQRRRHFSLSAFAAIVCVSAAALVQSMPAMAQEKEPLKIVVGFAPGGGVDVLARIIADAMQEDFSSIIVENRPGAAGRIALTQMKSVKADGRTVIVAPSPAFVMFPHIFKKLAYDPLKDFTPIGMIAESRSAVAAGPKAAGVNTMADMIAKVKADPKNGFYASSGEGSAGHLMGELIGQVTGVKLTNVPYAGGAPGNNALLAGDVSYKIDTLSEFLQLQKAGKVRILAVTGTSRDSSAPDVPTFKESGIDVTLSSWYAMFGPADMPKKAQQHLSNALLKALARPEVAERLVKQGFPPIKMDSDELAAQLKSHFAAWEKPAKATGLQLD